ncbi:hypothetical protein [Plantactinospora endophytica]|uniref:Uncharacterized protein n=1 Tax=Plantactinospora endophytica TaxID=673535 RepID=A0ABQ4DTF9_9ACTN|nr:hypothetical protein [Plantactinospora endophytica]GIG85714.1 hypothetical protein Pen02_06500 [Plantactinospora endophytica]
MTGDGAGGHAELERRYRRLLAWYPWEHRRAYEEEMLGVLLADSRPGQRWPAPGDAANLALTALRARLGVAARAVTDRSWADAAATAGLLLAILLCYLHALPLVRQLVWASAWPSEEVPYWYPDPALWTRTGLWALTLLAAVTGPRWLPALLAWPAVVVELVALPTRYAVDPVQVLQMSAQTLIGVICAAALTVPAPRRAALAVLGRRRLLTIGGVSALILAGSAVQNYLSFPGPGNPVLLLTIGLLLPVGVLVVAVAVWRVPAAVRRRLLVLLTPIVAVLLTVRYGLAGWAYSNQQMGHPIYLEPVQWAALTVVPLAALVLGFVLLLRREQTLRLVALGRHADRRHPHPDEPPADR